MIRGTFASIAAALLLYGLATGAGRAADAPRRAQPCCPMGAAAGQAPGSYEPKVIRSGEIAYLSGGIGETEQEQLRAREKEFNLKLVFSLVQGNYVADVDVVVSDAKGRKLVEHLAEGPFFMVKLPAGQYTVAATYEGKTVTRKVKVAAGGLRTEYLRWPAGPDDTPVSRWTEKP